MINLLKNVFVYSIVALEVILWHKLKSNRKNVRGNKSSSSSVN